MNRDTVLQAIARVAPDVEPELGDLDPTIDLWNELQLDSMDRLSVLSQLAEATGIEISDRDAAGLTSVDEIIAYLDVAT
jgi:acyl carrier protein